MDHIEMLWKCNICFTINGGLSKVCKGCGKALDTEEWFMPDDISTNANLYKPEDLDKALRGPDWHCPSCHSSQRQGDGQCANCGDKEIHSSNNITPLRPEYSELIFTKPFYKKPTIWIITFVIVLVLLLIWLLWPKTIYGIVVGSEWKSIVKVERYQSVREDGWTVPTDATLVTNEGLRIHHYDKIQIGTKKVPYSESYKCGETCRTTARRCKNNHNGTASCSGGNRVCSAKYCTRTAYRTENVYKNQPRYRDWYSWNVWRWRFNRNVMCSGLDFKPKLPENINLNQNLHDQEQERMFVDWAYTIIFKDKHSEDKYKYYPTSESAFLSFHIGDSHTLKVSGIGVSIEK